MSKPTIVACLATIAVVVPAGWRVLDADIPTDGPKLRPAAKTAKIGDGSVELQIDRGAILAGGKINATLVATADRAHDVTVALTAYQDMGFGEGRVSNPPQVVGKRTLTLHAAPGGGTPVVATFKIGTANTDGWTSRYYVTARPSKVKEDDEVASAEFFAWGGNSFAMTLEAPEKVPASGSFDFAVRVKNTTKQPIMNLTATAGGRFSSSLDGVSIYAGDEFSVENLDTATRDNDEDDTQALAPGAERTLHLRVVPRTVEANGYTVIVQASAEVKSTKHPEYNSRVAAMDIHTFVLAPDDDQQKAPVAER